MNNYYENMTEREKKEYNDFMYKSFTQLERSYMKSFGRRLFKDPRNPQRQQKKTGSK